MSLDYFSFGMGIKEREWKDSTFSYRFGFNGYENEPDIAGQGSVIDFGMRIYDSRLGRFFSTDPIVYPYWSPYQYDANSPIWIKDHNGMGIDPPKITGKEKDGEVSADSKWIFFASTDNPNSKSTWLKVPSEKEVDELYDNISKAMKKAKRNGAGEAVSNLSRWFDGVGGTKKESKKWLMRRPSYAEGIEENRERFKEQVNSSGVSLEVLAESLKDGETKKFSDYWEYMADPNGSQYGVTGGAKRDAIFYYSYGASTITSKGNFNLTRDGNTVTITGQITHSWNDTYNWEPGMSVNIPGFGTVEDYQLKYMEFYKGAKPFEASNSWTEDVNMTLESGIIALNPKHIRQ